MKKLLIASLCLLTLVGCTKNEKQTVINYKEYLQKNSVMKESRRTVMDSLSSLKTSLAEKTITTEEYSKQKETLMSEKKEIDAKTETLKESYGLDKDLDLNKVKFSEDEKEDERLKAIYSKEEELAGMDEALEAEEEALDQQFENGEITEEEFEARMLALEAREAELDRLDEELDALEEQLDQDEPDDADEEEEEEDTEEEDTDKE
ncbi:MAG: hypothetical protein RR659_02785 [Bacilli bacterium]